MVVCRGLLVGDLCSHMEPWKSFWSRLDWMLMNCSRVEFLSKEGRNIGWLAFTRNLCSLFNIILTFFNRLKVR